MFSMRLVAFASFGNGKSAGRYLDFTPAACEFVPVDGDVIHAQQLRN
ncbi:hypothetical protein [Paenibacillus amylolyticus]